MQSDPILEWLEKAHRNLGIVTSDQPAAIDELVPQWPGLATHHLGTIDYEPRSLAVSPTAERIVVGTKGGKIWCSELKAEGWAPFRPLIPPIDAAQVTLGEGAPRRVAIRGVTFLDHTQIAVGLQPGVWWLTDLADVECSEIVAPQTPHERDPAHPAFHLSRFERAFCVAQPGSWSTGYTGTVAVGVSGTNQVHTLEWVISKTRPPHWRARTRTIRRLFPELRECGRIVGAVSCQGAVWVLGDTGALMRLDTQGAWEKRSRKHPEYQVRAHVSGVRYRRLAACHHGLIVLTEKYLGFVPFDGELPRLSPGSAARRNRKAVHVSWVGAASAVDVAAVCERLASDQPGTQVRAILGLSSRPHLRIYPWTRPDDHDGQELDWQPDRGERAVLTPEGTVTETLHSQVATHRDGRRWLAAATRGGKIVIAPLIPLKALTALVRGRDRELPPLPHEGGGSMAYWRLRSLQDATVGTQPIGVDEALVDQLMSTMQMGETRRLLDRLIRRTFEVPPSLEVLNRFRVWVRCVMRWAHRADVHVDPAAVGSFVSRGIHTEVLRWNQAGRPTNPNETPPMDRETFAGHLELFADFMRKWFVGAESYGQHDENLTKLVKLNHECQHSLDALVYETRMLRSRCDLGWRRPGQRQVELASSTVAVAQAGAGALYVQRTSRGWWRAFGHHGTPLQWTLARTTKLQTYGEWLSGLSHEAEGCCLASTQAPDCDPPRYIVAWDAMRSGPSHAGSPTALVMVVLVELNGKQAIVIDELEIDVATQVDALAFGPQGNLVASLSPRSANQPSTFHVWDITVRHDRIQRGQGQQLAQWLGPGEILRSQLNRCTCIHVTKTLGALTVWAGFKDGTLSAYTASARRTSGRSGIASTEGLRFSSTITSVRSTEQRGGHILAVGTAEGQVGIFVNRSVQPLEGSRTKRWSPLVLYRERNTSIAGFIDFADKWPSDENGRVVPTQRLMAVSENGRVSVFDVDLEAAVRPPHPGRIGYRPRRYPGMRLDRFKLAQQVTCCSGGAVDGQPALFAGDAHGAIFMAVVVRTLLTDGRRRFLRQEMLPIYGQNNPSIGPTRSLALFVGGCVDERRAWLRVLPLPDDAMVEFALWHEWIEPLRTHVDAMGDPASAKVLLDTLRARIREFIPRGEAGYRALKVLWTAAARIAHQMAGRALAAQWPDEPDVYASHHLELLRAIRWTAAELGRHAPSRRANARTHSLGAIADWSLVMLLFDGSAAPRMGSSAEMFLRVVRDRLGDGPLQVSESLRHVNRSLWMALTYVATTPPDDPRWPRWRTASLSPPGGLGEIMRVASEAGKNHIDLVDPSAPLTLSLARCFALCILLVPAEAMEVALTVSSDRLFQQPAVLHIPVLTELQQLHEQLRAMPDVAAFGAAEEQRRTHAIDLFRAYLALLRTQPEHLRESRRNLVRPQSVKQTATKATGPTHDAEHHNPVLRLRKLAAASPDDPRLRELIVVLDLASWLSYLEGIGPGIPDFDRRWFEQESGVDYFTHSRALLVHLDKVRRQLVGKAHRLLQHDQDLRSAHWTCEKEQSDLDLAVAEGRLFEPERTLFHALVRAWLTEINDRVRAAVDLGTSFDFYNRHVYRRRADELLGWLTELAMQEAPCWHHDTQETATSMTSRLSSSLEGRHVVRQVFDGGRRLVESTHLMGTLSMVASEFIASGGALPGETTAPATIDVLAQQVAFEAGLGPHLIIQDEEPLLGATTVWHAILWELALNVKSHGSRPEMSPPLHVHYVSGVVSVRGARSFHEEVASHRNTTTLSHKELEAAIDNLVPLKHLLPQRNSSFARPGMGLPALSSICGFIGYQLTACLHLPDGVHWRQAPLVIQIRRRE